MLDTTKLIWFKIKKYGGFVGAGEGIQTLDFNLGKVAEYMVCLLFTEYWNNICKKINIFESKGLLGGYVKKYLFIIILNITLFYNYLIW